ncbi:RimJ/RimL family protein N-acetyltransferase [Clavibacter michiganensis]|uniref:GNAT family N-acetyltransferase n=1 Tax=Clavibacter michiganensis TaxID=28447 RepID=UPI001AE4927B|nr:GNAT family N-acetyltransferase [Clavibacter michiganensis]MBP2457469.1 RimJ/RimL family protein N-acetyltransferase [Clavibacter michiganensis]MDQ0410039.1 RimJ/RimL family protein N-acetyltransferase [Clavibacter michiganensis]
MTPDDDPTAAAPLDRVAWPVRTERLLLRRMSAADAPAMWTYRRLDEVTRWVTSRPVDEAAWIAGSAAMLRDQLVLELDGRVVGDLMVRVEDAWAQREVAHLAVGAQAELGWTLDPAVGGRGLATEAVRAALRIAFEGLGVRRVVANAFADNAPSLRLAERVGMRRESYAVADSLHRDLGWIDGVGYALLAEEWAARG